MIFGVLGLIVLAAIVLTISRARANDHDDDDDNTPGGRRRVRVPVRTNHRGPR